MIYLANEKYSSTLTAGYTVGQNVLSVAAVPDQVPTLIVAAKGTDNETVFIVTGKTTNSLTGVSRLRGANVNLDATTPITCLNNVEFINQYETAAKDVLALSALIYAADGGSSDAYAISLDPAPAAYTTGMVVAFKANTANTGPATLNVNSLGAKTIKKSYNQDLAVCRREMRSSLASLFPPLLSPSVGRRARPGARMSIRVGHTVAGDLLSDRLLADNDIKANQVVVVVYDGTNFQLVGPVNTHNDGWLPYLAVTPTRVGMDEPSYTLNFTGGTNLTTFLSPGMKVKWTQDSTVRYAIITAVTSTTIIIRCCTGYNVSDTATYPISNFHYSTAMEPYGFPSWKVPEPVLIPNTDGETITFDMNEGRIHTVVLGGNRTLALSNVAVGQCFILRLFQDATGGRTVTWFDTIKWAGGSAPTLTSTANKVDVFGFVCTSAGNYDGFIVGQNL